MAGGGFWARERAAELLWRGCRESWDKKYVEVEDEVLFHLILAANFLDIKDLLDLTCKTVRAASLSRFLFPSVDARGAVQGPSERIEETQGEGEGEGEGGRRFAAHTGTARPIPPRRFPRYLGMSRRICVTLAACLLHTKSFTVRVVDCSLNSVRSCTEGDHYIKFSCVCVCVWRAIIEVD